MIQQSSNDFSISMMCILLRISTSGYYAWRDRLPAVRAQQNAVLTQTIKVAFDEERARAGALRITKRLKAAGVQVGRHRVARIMRFHGWRAKAARKFKATTHSNHDLPVAPNLLQQDFTTLHPNEKYVSDITYIPITRQNAFLHFEVLSTRWGLQRGESRIDPLVTVHKFTLCRS